MNKNYTGIDYFRFIAALLIIAIHTSPLGSFSETGDFMLTRIIARVAVPFFFMTSGFFLISRYTCNAEKLGAFIKKTTLIYGVAILLYIPINVYNGYFKMDNLLPNIIKDIVFDGTLYHLWYLPASIIGAAIAWYLVKKVHYRKAFLIASVLYIIGLFGDSYYGIVKSVSCLNAFYNLIFQLTDYTRNGIFFAPIFFVLGGYISDNQNRLSLKRSISNRDAFLRQLRTAGFLAGHRCVNERKPADSPQIHQRDQYHLRGNMQLRRNTQSQSHGAHRRRGFI